MSGANVDPTMILFFTGVLWLTVMPLQISHLLSALAGVAGYLLLQSLQFRVSVPRPASNNTRSSRGAKAHEYSSRDELNRHARGSLSRGSLSRGGLSPRAARRPWVGAGSKLGQGSAHMPSMGPVSAPSFNGVGWYAEVQEMLGRIMPSVEGTAALHRIEQAIQQVVREVIPQAKVAAYAPCNIAARSAFGVAVPDVDVVITADPTVLVQSLQSRWLQNRRGRRCPELDLAKLQKSAIRACTDRLVGTGLFKFRRSAFRGREPKVTIICPQTAPGCSEQGTPANLLVNAASPRQCAALLAACERLEPRSKALALLVRRWAKDRGLCHSAKGHLPQYAWSLMAMYFLQVRAAHEGAAPLLPPLWTSMGASGPAVAAALPAAVAGRVAVAAAAGMTAEGGSAMVDARSVGELFKRFMHFYAMEFDWAGEAVSLRTGSRRAPGAKLHLSTLAVGPNGKQQVSPSIEDPFDEAHNLGADMAADSLERLWEELARARLLCSSGASLSVLPEPWVPPEVTSGSSDSAQLGCLAT